MRLVAIDPSLRATGWAVFEDGRLVSCGIVKTAAGTTAEQAAREVAQRLKNDLDGAVAVIERPQIYQGRRSKGDPNDLVGVALVAGACAAWADRAVFVLPHDWKGSIPKHAQLSRYIVHRRNEKALDDASCAVYRKCLAAWAAGLRHNLADAVGIGLHAMRQGLLDIPCRAGVEVRG